MATLGSLRVSGPSFGLDEWLEEHWTIGGTELGHPREEWQMNRRVRRSDKQFVVEVWTRLEPDDRQYYLLTEDDVLRTQAQDHVSFDSHPNSFPNTLEALPLQGAVTIGQPAPFILYFLSNVAVPLTKEERISTQVERIEGDTVFIDVSYSTGGPPQGLGFREVQSLTGTIEVSLSSGRPLRLQYNSSGIDWRYRFGGRIEPWEFTDDIHCEWTYPREPSAPVTVP